MTPNEQCIRIEDMDKMIHKQAYTCLRKLPMPSDMDLDDLVSEGRLLFYTVLSKYDETKGASFFTYFTRSLMNHFSKIVLKAYREHKKPLHDDHSQPNTTKRNDSSTFIREISGKFPSKNAMNLIRAILEPKDDEQDRISRENGLRKRRLAMSIYLGVPKREVDILCQEVLLLSRS